MKKITSFILSLLLIITNLNIQTLANTIGVYDKVIKNNTKYTAKEEENIKVAGKGVVAEITLPGVTINKSDGVSVSALRVENGATVKLTILGNNTLIGASGSAGISVDETSTLIIEKASTGELDVHGGSMAAAIGGDAGYNNGTVIIENGTINAYGGENAGAFADERGAAGIGGGNNGNGGTIIINGGTITTRGGDSSAGIGCGNGGETGNITINGGTIESNSGYHGPAIGGKGGSITINDGTIVANEWAYAAGIGGGSYSNCGEITINGGNIKAYGDETAIGMAKKVTINGGDIYAFGDGMTGGSNGIGEIDTLKITGGKIEAKGNARATAIEAEDILIEGGEIIALGGSEGAGIGNNNGKITITGGTITATGGYDAAGIGGRAEEGGCTIVITGGSIKATPGSKEAEAVGAGANGAACTLTNGDENSNQPVHLVAINNAVSFNKYVKVIAKVINGNQSYEYKYEGYGHKDDQSLYFYLTDNYTLEIIKSINGDSNGDGKLNQLDRMTLARYLAKWQGYENISIENCDVNKDSKVNQLDRMTLARHLAKWQGYETLPYTK